MDDVWIEIENELRDKMREVQKDFRATVKVEFDKNTGKLGRSFNPTVRKIGGEINSIHWEMPRYGWILHHGIERGTTSNRSKKSWVYKKGIRQSGFVNDVIQRHYGDIANMISNKVANAVVDVMRF
jgi:hypothetical protein